MSPAPRARRPRLLVVGPVPPPIGGVETCVQAVLESPALAPFDVAHCDITKHRPKSTQGSFEVANWLWALRHFTRLVRAMIRHRPDVVYVPISGTLSGAARDLALGWIARRWAARVLGHQHDGGIADVLARGGLTGRLVRLGFGQFHRLLVLGDSWRALFTRWGATMPVEICPSTYRRELHAAARAHADSPRAGGPLRALFVGQIGTRKGVPELVRALRALGDRGVNATLTLVGPDEQPGQTEAARLLAVSLAVATRLVFTGAVMGEALYAHYREHDVLVLPSHLEGLPVVLFEAGAFGLPVVTTPVGSITDLVRDGVNGLLVPPGDPGRLADALASLAADPGRRAALGARLRADIEPYHPDRVGARVAEAVWTELRAAGKVTGAGPDELPRQTASG